MRRVSDSSLVSAAAAESGFSACGVAGRPGVGLNVLRARHGPAQLSGRLTVSWGADGALIGNVFGIEADFSRRSVFRRRSSRAPASSVAAASAPDRQRDDRPAKTPDRVHPSPLFRGWGRTDGGSNRSTARRFRRHAEHEGHGHRGRGYWVPDGPYRVELGRPTLSQFWGRTRTLVFAKHGLSTTFFLAGKYGARNSPLIATGSRGFSPVLSLPELR